MAIKNLEEFHELATMADVAEETLTSLRFGNHWLLKAKLKSKHGLSTDTREDAIRQARRLCDEFITAYNAGE